ncbi:LysR family transcriptional regulator [Marinobacterium aestuariivivens]|uniref:LysR family transcriptional regulator n=1 Tax=Marinobacterium aestuariivivens TaxID=1698799 RepID=A0ABW2A8V2_9GAMM
MTDSRLVDTQLLNTFVTIAESSSLTDAAKRLGVTQSAVSQALKQLEEQMGAELVARRTKPVRLTAAGLVLKQNADTIIGELRRLSAAVRGAADKALVQCRLGLMTSCSEVFGSKLIARLSPFIERLTLRSGLTPPLMQAFLDRDIDILVANDPLTGVEGLERFELFRDPVLLAVSDGHLGPGPFSLEALAQAQPLIRYGRNTHIGAYSELVLRRMRILANVRYETDDTHTLMSFVQDGHGWGMLTALCLAQVLYRTDGVSLLELDRSRHARTVYLVAREGEMGAIPGQVADAIRQILHGPVLDALSAKARWLTPATFELNETFDLR